LARAGRALNTFAGFDRAERRRLAGFALVIAALHLAGWGLLLGAAASNPQFIALGWLAYAFGLRHAFDVDHIAAIDNTTRKLVQHGQRPLGAGFFFAVGHSAAVAAIALFLGLAARSVAENVAQDEGLRAISRFVATGVSGPVLVLIGVLNLAIFLEMVAVLRKGLRQGHFDASLSTHLAVGGPMTRIFGRAFRFVSRSWHLMPVGFLFGVGFDTASEVALLSISAGAAANGLPLGAVMSLPLIFAAGMTLMDTGDGALMFKAYDWALANPIRKIFYNLTITGLSVFVALFVGSVELLQLLASEQGWSGGLWDALASLDVGDMGSVIVGAFVATWLVALGVYRFAGVEQRWGAASPPLGGPGA
jgi:high-affinity nickel-transport protein